MIFHVQAAVAELADAADSKSADGNIVGVRFPSAAPYNQDNFQKTGSFFICTNRLEQEQPIVESHENCSFHDLMKEPGFDVYREWMIYG
jgi:hypothetical protein